MLFEKIVSTAVEQISNGVQLKISQIDSNNPKFLYTVFISFSLLYLSYEIKGDQ